MHVVLWRFEVRAGREAEFERAYGEDGDWAILFRGAAGFEGVRLMRASDGTYLTLDLWSDAAAHRAFLAQHEAAYARIDEACRELTVSESLIGEVDT